MEPKTSVCLRAEEELSAVEERIVEVRNILAQPLEMKCREAYVMYYVELVSKQQELQELVDVELMQAGLVSGRSIRSPHAPDLSKLSLTDHCPFVNCGMTSAFAKAIPTANQRFELVEREFIFALEALGSKVQQVMLHFNRSDPSQAFAFIFFVDEQDANNLFIKCYSKMQHSWQCPRWFTVVNMWGIPYEIQVDQRKQEKSRHKAVLMCRAKESVDCKIPIKCDIKHYSRDKMLLINDTKSVCHEWPQLLNRHFSAFDINTFRCVWKPSEAWMKNQGDGGGTPDKRAIESTLNGILFPGGGPARGRGRESTATNQLQQGTPDVSNRRDHLPPTVITGQPKRSDRAKTAPEVQTDVAVVAQSHDGAAGADTSVSSSVVKPLKPGSTPSVVAEPAGHAGGDNACAYKGFDITSLTRAGSLKTKPGVIDQKQAELKDTPMTTTKSNPSQPEEKWRHLNANLLTLFETASQQQHRAQANQQHVFDVLQPVSNNNSNLNNNNNIMAKLTGAVPPTVNQMTRPPPPLPINRPVEQPLPEMILRKLKIHI